MAGAALTAVWAFAIFPLMASGSFLLAVLAIAVGLTFLGMMYGPQAAFFAELFSTIQQNKIYIKLDFYIL